ncbi:MAG: DUF2961 domain-containing protein [Planctomycetes bacterium]|nr:DUF2961 domain-containing protein [Planctomycetota bacterium]
MRIARDILFFGVLLSLGGMAASADPSVPDVARIRKGVTTGFSNAGWCYDRYKDLEPLKAHTQITVADIKGPAVIKHIHTTRHQPKELMSRGIVLEIWFDDANEPAVMCPLADFFGDGCSGKGMYFSANLIECAPWSYNCYFAMPFKSRAKVDYATVYYWYQDKPGSYKHEPLRPAGERAKDMLSVPAEKKAEGKK